MMGPAMVVLLAGGVSAIMNNTQTHGHHPVLDGAGWSAAPRQPSLPLLTVLVNIPLGGARCLPVRAMARSPCRCWRRWPTSPASSRATTITAWIMGHGLALMFSPTSVVLVGGLAIAKVGYDQFPTLCLAAAAGPVRGVGGRHRRSRPRYLDRGHAAPLSRPACRLSVHRSSFRVQAHRTSLRRTASARFAHARLGCAVAGGLFWPVVPARWKPPPPEIRPVRTITVAPRADQTTSVALTGTVQAQNEINLSFRIDGRLVERTVDIGDNVKSRSVDRPARPAERRELAYRPCACAARGRQCAAGRSAQQLHDRMRRAGGRGRGLARAVRAGQGVAAIGRGAGAVGAGPAQRCRRTG